MNFNNQFCQGKTKNSQRSTFTSEVSKWCDNYVYLSIIWEIIIIGKIFDIVYFGRFQDIKRDETFVESTHLTSTSRYYQLFSKENPEQTGAIPKVFPKPDNTHIPKFDPFERTNQESWHSFPQASSSDALSTKLKFQASNDSNYHDYPKGKSKSKAKAGKPFCEFCKNNNEERSVYMSHVLKDLEGRVVCPVSLYAFHFWIKEAYIYFFQLVFSTTRL